MQYFLRSLSCFSFFSLCSLSLASNPGSITSDYTSQASIPDLLPAGESSSTILATANTLKPTKKRKESPNASNNPAGKSELSESLFKKAKHESSATNPTSVINSTQGSNFVPKTLFEKFTEIIQSEPHPIQPMKEITAQDEDRDGSRKWVKFFSSTKEESIHQWHNDMSSIIKALRAANASKMYLPPETNFAIARLVFILKDGDLKIIDMPYFFISGWPSNGNKAKMPNFAKDLAEEKLGEKLKLFKDYTLRFITMSYKGSITTQLQDRSYDPYKTTIKDIMSEELKKKDSIPGENRLRLHQKLMTGSDTDILGKQYFHSEQSIWMAAKEEIKKFKDSCKKKSTGDLRAHFSSTINPIKDPIKQVFIDICSFYDMCWCCADTFASCCHSKHLDAEVYVRSSGCSKYWDGPFVTGYALRDHRTEFTGYEKGQAFQIPTKENPDLYKPYIAHAIAEDFQ